ncbi:hypothetical protein [Lunatimonas salinarum]|uniref:hypothetical protein n=1 Tax=Lunatimonas salinarum TaxID=1774590 RepID=UPI001ADFA0E4|nr:hypothetical protein [Lunatimonas salinarum]
MLARDKTPEKLPIHRLPLESTNAADIFKYLMMRKVWIRHVRGARKPEEGDASVRG